MAPQLRVRFYDPRSQKRQERRGLEGELGVLDYHVAQEYIAASSKLSKNHSQLGTWLKNQQNVPREILDALAHAEASASMLGSLTEGVRTMFPPNRRLTHLSARKADVVFSIPELLENILSWLTSWQMLAAQQVNRTWRDTILQSAPLKIHLGLQPNPKGFFSSPIHGPEQYENDFFGRPKVGFPGITVEIRKEWYCCEDDDARPPSLDIKIPLALENFFEQNPSPGSRIRSMLLCQPPMNDVTVEVVEKGGHETWHEVHFENGFTIGDFLNCTAYFSHQHVMARGKRPVWMEYTRTMQLSSEDPIVKRHKEETHNEDTDKWSAEVFESRQQKWKNTGWIAERKVRPPWYY